MRGWSRRTSTSCRSSREHGNLFVRCWLRRKRSGRRSMTHGLPRFVSSTGFASSGRRTATSADFATFASEIPSPERSKKPATRATSCFVDHRSRVTVCPPSILHGRRVLGAPLRHGRTVSKLAGDDDGRRELLGGTSRRSRNEPGIAGDQQETSFKPPLLSDDRVRAEDANEVADAEIRPRPG